MSLSPGNRLGPYEILAPLGAGGMGEVYRARDTRLGREVAIKVLAGSAAEQSGRFRRFQTEAESTAALAHPNVVAVFDIGQAEGLPYIVSELVTGGTLAGCSPAVPCRRRSFWISRYPSRKDLHRRMPGGSCIGI